VITRLTLNDDARGLSTVLKPRYDAVAFQGLDVQGTVREAVDDLPGRDGTLDLTEFASAAAVTLTLRFWGQFRALMDEVNAYAAPWARPYLQVTDDEWAGDRLLRLRYSTANKPIVTGTGASRVAAYQWKAPSGCWEDTSPSEYMIPAGTGFTGGMHVQATSGVRLDPAAGLHFTPSSISADSLVTVGGDMRPPWTAFLYGPCTGPRLHNDSTGEALIFTDDLVLGAGEYVALDSAARSANLLSDPDASRLTYLDWPSSTWFSLTPGVSLLRYAPSLASAGSMAQLTFTPRRMA
jgi:hypothetical protein